MSGALKHQQVCHRHLKLKSETEWVPCVRYDCAMLTSIQRSIFSAAAFDSRSIPASAFLLLVGGTANHSRSVTRRNENATAFRLSQNEHGSETIPRPWSEVSISVADNSHPDITSSWKQDCRTPLVLGSEHSWIFMDRRGCLLLSGFFPRAGK